MWVGFIQSFEGLKRKTKEKRKKKFCLKKASSSPVFEFPVCWLTLQSSDLLALTVI